MFSITQLLGDSLRELDLTLCVNVTDLSVRSIATYLQRLVVLRLGWCKEITDWGLLGMVETTICEPDQEMVRPAVVLPGPRISPGTQAHAGRRPGDVFGATRWTLDTRQTRPLRICVLGGRCFYFTAWRQHTLAALCDITKDLSDVRVLARIL